MRVITKEYQEMLDKCEVWNTIKNTPGLISRSWTKKSRNLKSGFRRSTKKTVRFCGRLHGNDCRIFCNRYTGLFGGALVRFA